MPDATRLPPVSEVLVDWSPGEVRAVLVRDDRPWELLVARTGRAGIVGNIYLGRIAHIDRGLDAAFVDVGETRPGLLRLPRRSPLHEGQSLLVQATKDAFADKGPSLSARILLPGRYSVFTPDQPGVTGARRIADPELREAFRTALGPVLGADEGVELRASAAHTTPSRLLAEIDRHRSAWRSVGRNAAEVKAPALLHRGRPPLLAFMQDLLPSEPVPVQVDDRQTMSTLRRHFDGEMPEYADMLELHRPAQPLFEERGIDDEIEAVLRRELPLPGGGTIAIEHTRALTAIDVDTGNAGNRSGGADRQSVNLSAAREVARLIRFRNIAGLIAVDFAGGDSPRAAHAVASAIRSNFAEDRAALRFGTLSEFGLFELSRERLGPSLADIMSPPVGHETRANAETRIIMALRRLVRARPSPPDCLLSADPQELGLLENGLEPTLKEAERRLGYPVKIVPRA